jgi:Uma2 family endonuclease
MSIANFNTLPPSADAALGPIPPLQTGDHLTRDEFERRYHAMPKEYRAELIEGIVYVMGPPVSDPGHSRPHFRLIGWLAFYEAHTPGVAGGDNGTIRLDLKNEPQPDTFLRILPTHGGQTRDTEDKYIEGAPELVAEIAGSSVSYDLHEKLEAYRRNGVREYIVWRVWDNAIDWFQLRDGQYVPLIPDGQAVIKSTAFPGLWMDLAAMLGGQSAKVLALLQQGLASPEHLQFVQKLQAQGGGANA